jgi:CheY-like chemotaxis protein
MRDLILIVDDDEDIREALAMVLEKRGYEAVTAGNGRLGLDRLAAGLRPSVILLDLMMPIMNGWDFLRHVTQDEDLARIPVVVLTGYVKMAGDGPIPGTVGLLSKPIEVPALLRLLAGLGSPAGTGLGADGSSQ